ncbi:SGNH/GDSL hydrolase family protein [Paracidobacterium acidisoli]|nr:SGNH/GDSL hydrolase family protein [Paracidobacterium acidisoli]
MMMRSGLAVGTAPVWCAAAIFGAMFAGSAFAADKPAADWVGTWAASPVAVPVKADESAANATYRDVVHISLGGNTLRVQLTNEFGSTPLKVGAAHLAASAGSGAIQAGSDHALMFGGKPDVIIPAGAFVLSDPVTMTAAAMSDLAVSVYVPDQPLATKSCHSFAASTNYTMPGDETAAATPENAKETGSWCFVKGVEVKAGDKDAAIVAFGDSITDGAHSTANANHRWPDYLAARLQADKKLSHLSVLDEGIGGNRVLRDGYGPSALARFDRDVLSQDGVKYVIVLESINDIGRIHNPADPDAGVTAEDLIWGLTQLVTRAHAHGIKIYGATLTPYMGAGYSTERGEQVREAVNQWIRTGGVFDGAFDFDKATQDPQKPTWFLPADDSGDHLHPQDAGYKAMADAIDLKMFK